MIIAITVITIIIILLLLLIINNNNNNNDHVTKNQIIWLKKCFLRLCLLVFKLLVYVSVSGIWFQNVGPMKDKGFWPVFVFGKGRLNFKKLWRRDVVVITTAQLHSTKPELRFCASWNPARSVWEIHDVEDFWQWSRVEIRL